MLRKLRDQRRGFTLAETLVVVALVAILAAVTVPTVKARLTESYEDSLIQELDNLESAILAYRQDMGHYPPRLDYLTALPASPTDACLNALVSTSGYRGPYVAQPISSTVTGGVAGFVYGGTDTIADTLRPRQTGALVGSSGDFYAIYVRGPSATTDADIDLKVDGIASGTAGTIRYPSLGVAPTHDSLIFVIPVKTGAC